LYAKSIKGDPGSKSIQDAIDAYKNELSIKINSVFGINDVTIQ